MPEVTTLATRVLEALVASGTISAAQLAAARGAGGSDADAGRSLLSEGVVSHAGVGAVLEEALGVPQVDLASYAPDELALVAVPADAARARRVLPLFIIEGILTVAIGDPADVFEIDELSRDLSLEVELVLADGPAVATAIKQHYGEPAAPPKAMNAPVYFDGVPIVTTAEDLEISIGDFFDVAEDRPAPAKAAPAEKTGEAQAAPAAPRLSAPPAQTVADVVAASEASSGIDLDVLAVADERTLSVLVADILEQGSSAKRTASTCCPTRTTSSSSSVSAGAWRRSQVLRFRCRVP